jgi:hypothetical protein
MQFVVLLATVFLSSAAGAKADEWRVHLDTEGPIAEAHEKKILAELAKLDRSKLANDDWAKEWAGSYSSGSRQISIAPRSGVAYIEHTCCGLGGANHGEIVEAFSEGVKVSLAVDPDHPGDEFMSPKLYFVRWGHRKYLVPQRQMIQLASSYNYGGAQREGLWGIPIRAKPGDIPGLSYPDPEPAGCPALPLVFTPLIVEHPTRLKITSLKVTKEEKTESGMHYLWGDIAIDVGRNRGMCVGLKINCDAGERCGSIRLDEVDNLESRGKFAINLLDKTAPSLRAGTEIFLPGAKPAARGGNS